MGRLTIILAGAGLGLVLFLSFGAGPVMSAGGSMPADPRILENTCTECHDLEEIVDKRFYMAEWQKIVARMVAYDSSEISQIDKLKVLKYIKENLAVDGPGGRTRQKTATERQ